MIVKPQSVGLLSPWRGSVEFRHFNLSVSDSPPSHSPGSHLTLPSPSRAGKEWKWNLLRLELFQREQNLELCRKEPERRLGRHGVSKAREHYPPWVWKLALTLGTQNGFVFPQSPFPFCPSGSDMFCFSTEWVRWIVRERATQVLRSMYLRIPPPLEAGKSFQIPKWL